MRATKRAQQADDDAPADAEAEESSSPPPVVTPTAISTKETDYMGLALITPGTESKDYMGRLTTATVDYMGRTLLDV